MPASKITISDDVTVKTAATNFSVTLEGDSSTDFKNYQALNRTKTDLLDYADLIAKIVYLKPHLKNLSRTATYKLSWTLFTGMLLKLLQI